MKINTFPRTKTEAMKIAQEYIANPDGLAYDMEYESVADYIISGAENGTGYYEYFDNSELDESGEPTQEQIDELKNFLSDNYNYIPE